MKFLLTRGRFLLLKLLQTKLVTHCALILMVLYLLTVRFCWLVGTVLWKLWQLWLSIALGLLCCAILSIGFVGAAALWRELCSFLTLITKL
jgi:hypothetical protein